MGSQGNASTQSQLKRKASAAALPSAGRTVKRRASKACHCCRSRKVRCDVVESGIPCTNCRLDEVECVVTEGKRRRKSYTDGEIFKQSPPTSNEEEKQRSTFTSLDDIKPVQALSNSLDAGMFDFTENDLEYDLNHHRPHMLYQTQGHRLSTEERNRRMSAISGSRPALQSPSQATHPSPYFPRHSIQLPPILPPYIEALPSSILVDDLDYLQRKGVFTVPDSVLRNELLRSYAQYVHPYLPLLDLQDFLVKIDKNELTNQTSLLLFQAVMFAATAYVDMRYLTAQGYDTRKEARKSFFQRVKLLYDFDYETDRVTIVQALLLMTYWYEKPDDPKDVWHWTGVAISLAQTIGLNCDTSNARLSIQTKRLWKRIWWCCYMRDRLIAIGMRRPMRINDDDFSVQMLELADFETDAMPVELCRMLGGCPAVRDSAKQITMSKMCIVLAKLCQSISHVLEAQYSILGRRLGTTRETTMRLVPKKSIAEASDIMQCDQELEEWHKNLSSELHYFAHGSRERIINNDGEVVHLHRVVLTGVYFTIVSALHRPQVMPHSPEVTIPSDLQELSRKRVREAADGTTEMFKNLYAHDMIRYLPNTGVTILLPAIIIHLLDIKSADSSVRSTSIRHFQFCMQALQRLREIYASADSAFVFLDAAARKADIQIAPLATSDKAPATNKTVDIDTSKIQPGVLTLTPPPEAVHTANQLLFASTLAPEERKFFEAFTPPGSEQSLNSILSGAGPNTSIDIEEPENKSCNRPRGLRKAASNDFESLIDLDGNTDFFMAEETLFNDLNFQWLAGEQHGYEGKADEGDQLGQPNDSITASNDHPDEVTGDIESELLI